MGNSFKYIEATEYLENGFDSVGFFILNKDKVRIYANDPEFAELDTLRREPIRKRTEEYCKILQDAHKRAGTSKVKYGNII